MSRAGKRELDIILESILQKKRSFSNILNSAGDVCGAHYHHDTPPSRYTED